MTHRFSLNCVVPPAYRGSINTWAVMVMQSPLYHPDPLIQNVSKVVVPLRLSGTVVNQSSIAELKADARAYIPRFMTRYFDKPAIPLSFPRPSRSMVPSFMTEVVAASHGRLPKLLKEEDRWHPLSAVLKGNSVTADRDVPAIIDSLIMLPNSHDVTHHKDALLWRKVLHLELEEACLRAHYRARLVHRKTRTFSSAT